MQKAAAAKLSESGTRQQEEDDCGDRRSHKQPNGFPARMKMSKRRQRQRQLWHGAQNQRVQRVQLASIAIIMWACLASLLLLNLYLFLYLHVSLSLSLSLCLFVHQTQMPHVAEASCHHSQRGCKQRAATTIADNRG